MIFGLYMYDRKVFGACVFALVVLAGLMVSTDSAHARTRAEALLIIDSSISMAGKISKKSKISQVRNAIRPALKLARSNLNLGVIFYGHRRRGDCKDVQHVIRLGKIQQNRYMQIINDFAPKGRTAIPNAVSLAAGILKKRGQSNSIILITDGYDICKGDPCALGKKLQQQNSGLKVHVIAVRSQNTKLTSLRCLAKSTGGRFIAANTPKALQDAVAETLQAAAASTIPLPRIAPHRLSASQQQQPVIETSVGENKTADSKTELSLRTSTATTEIIKTPDTLKAQPAESTTSIFDSFFGRGKKTKDIVKPVVAQNDGSVPEDKPAKPGFFNLFERPQTVEKPDDTGAQASANALVEKRPEGTPAGARNSGLNLFARLGSDGPFIEKDLSWRISRVGKAGGKPEEIQQLGKSPSLDLKPGKYDVTVQLGTIVHHQTVTLEANKPNDAIFSIDAGIIETRAVRVVGGRSLDKNVSYTLFSANKDDIGNHIELNRATPNQTRFYVKPGRYHLVGKLGSHTLARNLTVTTGKTSVVNFVFNTGILKLSAVAGTGGAVVTGVIYTLSQAQIGAEGQRQEVRKSVKNQSIFTLPAGSYHLKVQHGLASVEQKIEIKANKTKILILNLNAGYLKLFASPAKGAGILKDKVHYTVYKGAESLDGKREEIAQSAKSSPTFWLPAGDYFIKATYGLAVANIKVKIKANKRSEETIIINAGALRLGSKVDGQSENLKSDVFYVIYESKADIEGKRREVFSTAQAEKTIRIPPGAYLIEGYWGNTNAKISLSAEVTAGKLTTVSVVHRAGRAKFKLTEVSGGTPTAKPYWTFFDLNGNEIGRNVIPTPERIFAAGKYAVVVRYDNQEFRAEFSIKSGDQKQIDIIAKQ